MNDLKISAKQHYLKDCLLEIEKKLDWGDSSQWSSYDFEKLSDNIYQVTNNKLSANTLKRVWGKLNYESDPSTTTLNILSQYLGYEDWRNFITKSKKRNIPSNSKGFKKHYLFAVLILIMVALMYTLLSGSSFLKKKSTHLTSAFLVKRFPIVFPIRSFLNMALPRTLKMKID